MQTIYFCLDRESTLEMPFVSNFLEPNFQVKGTVKEEMKEEFF